MKFENTKVFNFEGALRGMRNPLNSWARSDSDFSDPNNPVIGEKDLDLAIRLIKGGSEHRKFLRQIFVSVDITAPQYFLAELDTYKVGVTRNSCSFQHKGTSKTFKITDFQVDNEKVVEMLTDHSSPLWRTADEELLRECCEWEGIINALNSLRDKYLETKDYSYFRKIRQLLPMSYLYKATFTFNYENLLSMYGQRKNHKLHEWSGLNDSFCAWARSLPYARDFIVLEKKPPFDQISLDDIMKENQASA